MTRRSQLEAALPTALGLPVYRNGIIPPRDSPPWIIWTIRETAHSESEAPVLNGFSLLLEARIVAETPLRVDLAAESLLQQVTGHSLPGVIPLRLRDDTGSYLADFSDTSTGLPFSMRLVRWTTEWA